MPKIRNWSRDERYVRGGGSFKAGWTHDMQGDQILIQDTRDTAARRVGPKPVSVRIIEKRPDKPDNKRTIKRFSTFEDARSFAVDWMRRHPQSIDSTKIDLT